jgi:hypothetical protein
MLFHQEKFLDWVKFCWLQAMKQAQAEGGIGSEEPAS